MRESKKGRKECQKGQAGRRKLAITRGQGVGGPFSFTRETGEEEKGFISRNAA
jgi:hypothetical protein